MSDINAEYVKSMFHTGQYELNEDIVDGEFDRWLASVTAEAWDEGFSYRGEWNLPQDNPYRTKQGD